MIVKAKSKDAHAAAMRAEIVRSYADSIRSLEALPNDGTRILAWPYGMGVKVAANGAPCPVELHRATPVRDMPKPFIVNGIFNGAQVRAEEVDRYSAAQAYAAELRGFAKRMLEGDAA